MRRTSKTGTWRDAVRDIVHIVFLLVAAQTVVMTLIAIDVAPLWNADPEVRSLTVLGVQQRSRGNEWASFLDEAGERRRYLVPGSTGRLSERIAALRDVPVSVATVPKGLPGTSEFVIAVHTLDGVMRVSPDDARRETRSWMLRLMGLWLAGSVFVVVFGTWAHAWRERRAAGPKK